MKVLIADDSLLLCARLISMLAEFEEVEFVGPARNALQATQLMNKAKPEVVILDIQMGKDNGIDVLKRSKYDQPSLIAIMLSNHSSVNYRKRCMEAGADYFFDKSTEFFALQDLFRDLTHRPLPTQLYDWTNKSLPRYSE
ncbi:MAG TPA: response regulator transcription factor [Bacteroidota bacterium]|nr:response regulator transcription factor [Bacteroidota bacterium]